MSQHTGVHTKEEFIKMLQDGLKEDEVIVWTQNAIIHEYKKKLNLKNITFGLSADAFESKNGIGDLMRSSSMGGATAENTRFQPMIDALDQFISFHEYGLLPAKHVYEKAIAVRKQWKEGKDIKQWQPIETAPKDGTTIEITYDREGTQTCLARWSDNPICMLGSRCGSFPPGWATPSEGDTDNNLPLDPPLMWREWKEGKGNSQTKAKEGLVRLILAGAAEVSKNAESAEEYLKSEGVNVTEIKANAQYFTWKAELIRITKEKTGESVVKINDAEAVKWYNDGFTPEQTFRENWQSDGD